MNIVIVLNHVIGILHILLSIRLEVSFTNTDFCNFFHDKKLPFININQLKLFYVENRLKGTPLLFIHGWLGSSFEWIYQIAYFKSRNHIILLDLPGYGKSDKPNENYSIDFFSKVIVDFIHQLGYTKAILIGHSLGGLIAQNIAIQNPELVNKLILISTSAISQLSFNKFLLFWINAIFRITYTNFLKGTLKRINSIEEENREFRRQLKYALTIPKPVVLRTFNNMTFKFNKNENIADISQPTLILYGTDDRIITKSELVTLDSLIPNSELHIIENSPHRVMVKSHIKVNKLIHDFVMI
ncbi:MAG: alpha/beta hydrolase [Candidatus Lokiarchaeota archaeon]|nr:alpha/beta hydrolase [Candidatus Lokiarchaeota archaeon]